MVTPHPAIVDCFRTLYTLGPTCRAMEFYYFGVDLGANLGGKSTCIYTGIFFSVSPTGSL